MRLRDIYLQTVTNSARMQDVHEQIIMLKIKFNDLASTLSTITEAQSSLSQGQADSTEATGESAKGLMKRMIDHGEDILHLREDLTQMHKRLESIEAMMKGFQAQEVLFRESHDTIRAGQEHICEVLMRLSDQVGQWGTPWRG